MADYLDFVFLYKDVLKPSVITWINKYVHLWDFILGDNTFPPPHFYCFHKWLKIIESNPDVLLLSQGASDFLTEFT